MIPIHIIIVYIYLGNVFMVTDDDWAAVILNIRKVRKWWEKILQILGQQGGEYSVLRPLLQGRVPNHPTIRVGDMGPEDRCGSDPRGFPSKVDLSDDGATAVTMR